jgi:hypothetical protein
MGVEEAGADDLGAEDLSAEPGRGADAVARAYAEGMRPPLTEHLAVSLRERLAAALPAGAHPSPDRVNPCLEAWEQETGIRGPRLAAWEEGSARMTGASDPEHPRRPFGGQ